MATFITKATTWGICFSAFGAFKLQFVPATVAEYSVWWIFKLTFWAFHFFDLIDGFAGAKGRSFNTLKILKDDHLRGGRVE
jgi:hypothetical protein